MPDKKIICLAVDDEPPALEVLKKYISSVHMLELAGTCADAIEAINFLRQNPVDLIFLDIKMPELQGTDFIKTLKNPPRVIFTTAYRKFAIEGFELDAVDYLLKPISFERFLKAVNKVMELQPVNPALLNSPEPVQDNNTDSIYFRSERKMVKVAMDDILYVESLKDYIKVVTKNKTIVTKNAISSLEENLPKNNFLRIHRSFIVAINKIDSYSTELIEIGKQELPISRMYRYEVEKVLQNKKHLM
ncbi:MAG TPA: LytTR family DNA-binding domain-containing protein [Chitinophagaceae bacterium]|nr:LytTR family DNA-binding domain-containing protein [Chitinophagaceae bacterium]